MDEAVDNMFLHAVRGHGMIKGGIHIKILMHSDCNFVGKQLVN